MMPPDIASIDSDISKPYFTIIFLFLLDKLTAMTPNPINGSTMNWGPFDKQYSNVLPHYNDFSATKNSQFNPPVMNYGGGAMSQFDDSQSIYDSKYSPSTGAAY